MLVSGYDDFNYVKTAITIGVEEYLLKPVSRQDFVGVLEKIRGAMRRRMPSGIIMKNLKRTCSNMSSIPQGIFLKNWFPDMWAYVPCI